MNDYTEKNIYDMAKHPSRGMLIILFLLCTFSLFSKTSTDIYWAKEYFNASFHSLEIQQQVNITIRGNVTDENGEPIIGANVIELGTMNGTVTDVEGNFTLNIPPNAILRISYIGYIEKDVPIDGRTTLNITLEEDRRTLDEVVVVGYGTQKKFTVTGSVSSVSSDVLIKSPAASIANTLAGRVTGLSTIQYSGMPGADDPRILVRGIGSLFESRSAPLIMVDGVERSFTQLDPNEVESITVLKDASATAVYGIRGANGVILVTTKRGSEGTPTVSFTTSFGLQSPTKLLKYADAYTYATSYNQAQLNDNPNAQLKFSDEAIEAFRTGSDPLIYPDMDWPSIIFKPASLQTNNNVNISGGTDIVKYFVSVGYLRQDGMFNTFGSDVNYNFGYDRYNYRANIDVDVTKSTKISLTTGGRSEVRSMPYQSGNPGWTINDLFEYMNWAAPFTGPGIVDGKYIRVGNTYISGAKYDALDHFYNLGTTKFNNNVLNLDILLTQNLDFITKGLSYRIKYANNSSFSRTKNMPVSRAYYEPYFEKDVDPTKPDSKEVVFRKFGIDGQRGFSESSSKSRNWYFETALSYSNSFGDHNITGLILYNANKIFYPAAFRDIPLGYVGIAGRVTYDYMTKYMLDINLGYNGSENFAKGKRFGLFPAVSVGWIPTEEPFMKDIDFIDYLKFRASYGIVGNDIQGGNRFLYLPDSYLLQSGGYNFGTDNPVNQYTASEGQVGNPNVTWEKARKRNIGVDLRIINSKLGFTFDLFDEYRNNILTTRQVVPEYLAITLPAVNIGEVENRGYELSIEWRDKLGDFNYFINSNVSFSRNKILFSDEIPKKYDWLLRTGKPVGQRWGLIWDGFWSKEDVQNYKDFPDHNMIPVPGDMRYKDINQDGRIDNYDTKAIGYPEYPEYVFGANIGFNFKNFDLVMLFSGATHTSRNLQSLYRTAFGSTHDHSLLQYMVDGQWTPEKGNNATYPRLGLAASAANNLKDSDFWMKDASYIRLKNVELGYNFNTSGLKRLGIGNMRVYLNGYNLYTWDRLKVIDPEASGGDMDYLLMKIFNIGLSVKF